MLQACPPARAWRHSCCHGEPPQIMLSDPVFYIRGSLFARLGAKHRDFYTKWKNNMKWFAMHRRFFIAIFCAILLNQFKSYFNAFPRPASLDTMSLTYVDTKEYKLWLQGVNPELSLCSPTAAQRCSAHSNSTLPNPSGWFCRAYTQWRTQWIINTHSEFFGFDVWRFVATINAKKRINVEQFHVSFEIEAQASNTSQTHPWNSEWSVVCHVEMCRRDS